MFPLLKTSFIPRQSFGYTLHFCWTRSLSKYRVEFSGAGQWQRVYRFGRTGKLWKMYFFRQDLRPPPVLPHFLHSRKHSHTNRFPLNLAVSLDGGDHWSQPVTLESIGEFPAAIATADGSIHITYAITSSTSAQRRIKHIVVDPTQLDTISK